jgi:hypothetical protein
MAKLTIQELKKIINIEVRNLLKEKGINKHDHDFHANKRASSLKEAQKCKDNKDCAGGCTCHKGNCVSSTGGDCHSYKRPKNEVLKEAREAVRKNGGCGCGKKR